MAKQKGGDEIGTYLRQVDEDEFIQLVNDVVNPSLIEKMEIKNAIIKMGTSGFFKHLDTLAISQITSFKLKGIKTLLAFSQAKEINVN